MKALRNSLALIAVVCSALPALAQPPQSPTGSQVEAQKQQRSRSAAVSNPRKDAVDARVRAQHENAMANGRKHAEAMQRNAALQARLRQQHINALDNGRKHTAVLEKNREIQARIRAQHDNAVANAHKHPVKP